MEENEIDARSKSISFENTNELAELILNDNIRSILSLIQYNRSLRFQEAISNDGVVQHELRIGVSPISIFVIGNESVPVPIQYTDHFKILRAKDEKDMIDIHFRLHPHPPYYIEFKNDE